MTKPATDAIPMDLRSREQSLPQSPEEFFRILHGDDAPGFLNIFTLPGDKSHFIKANLPTVAAKTALELAPKLNVYFGLGLLREPLLGGRRGAAEDVITIPGFWADIDIFGPNHKQTALPKTQKEAVELAYALPWGPSLIVFSGGGIQAFWLFKEPWHFGSDEERDQAAGLSRRFQDLLIAEGKKCGWVIDYTGDLPRVLRVPGTYNRKHDPVLVRVIEYHPDRRYNPSDFEDFLPADDGGNGRHKDSKLDTAAILAGIDEGGRDSELTRYALSLVGRKFSEAEQDTLISAAAAQCRPEFPKDEALKKLASARRKFAAEQPKQKPWVDVSPLPALLPLVPEMPAKIIPAPLRDFVADISERMQVAKEVPAVSILAALSSLVGRSIGILPKRFDNWLVIPNLWGYVAARSGMLKTPAVEEATKPLGLLAVNARKQYEANSAEHGVDEEIASARVVAVKARIAKAAKEADEGQLRILKEELLNLQRQADSVKPIERRYRINDGTTEKLLELLVDNPRGLFVYRDELSGYLRSLDKVGREMDRAFYLESWNGYGAFTTDRIGRGTVHVDGLCLSIFGGIQPPKLASYVSDALDSTSNDDGFLQRFQLAVYPETPKVWNLIDRTPDRAARDRATRVFEIIDSYNPAALGVPLSHSEIPGIHFDDDAQELFNDWLIKLQGRILQGDGSPAFESHLAKYRKLMPALALLFHLADWAENQIQGSLLDIPTVSLESARLAAAWCEYLELHARKIYAGTLNPDLQAAHLILVKIKQGKVKDGTTTRDIYRNQWQGLQTKERVFQGLLLLTDCGYLRLESTKSEKGGPSGDFIVLNPKVRSKSNAV